MSGFPGFGGWINQNFQERPEAETRRSEDVKSNSVSEKDTNLKPWYDEPGKTAAMEPGDVRSKPLHAVDTKYFDVNDMKRQSELWHGEKKKHPWYPAPAKVEAESRRSENVKSNSESEKETNLKPWYDEPGKSESVEPGEAESKKSKSVSDMNSNNVDDEEMEEGKLWRDAEKKHPWYDAPPKVKAPKSSENVESKSVSEMDNGPAKMKRYYDEDEWERQDQLWTAAEKKHPWKDAPPKVKVVITKKAICHMHIELTLGLHPDGVFELFTNQHNGPNTEPVLKSKSRKVLKEDGPRQIAKVEKVLAWNFSGRSFSVPISLIVDENRKDLTAKYTKEKIMLMKVFEGSYKVEPLYVDSVRLCKNKEPKSVEEYKKCSGGQGKIASKVTMDQYFQPYPPFNLPPLSWFIRDITIKNTKNVLDRLQLWGFSIRNPGVIMSTNKHGKTEISPKH
ncbi:unnamed protein product [Arabidopsis halleri]